MDTSKLLHEWNESATLLATVRNGSYWRFCVEHSIKNKWSKAACAVYMVRGLFDLAFSKTWTIRQVALRHLVTGITWTFMLSTSPDKKTFGALERMASVASTLEPGCHSSEVQTIFYKIQIGHSAQRYRGKDIWCLLLAATQYLYSVLCFYESDLIYCDQSVFTLSFAVWSVTVIAKITASFCGHLSYYWTSMSAITLLRSSAALLCLTPSLVEFQDKVFRKSHLQISMKDMADMHRRLMCVAPLVRSAQRRMTGVGLLMALSSLWNTKANLTTALCIFITLPIFIAGQTLRDASRFMSWELYSGSWLEECVVTRRLRLHLMLSAHSAPAVLLSAIGSLDNPLDATRRTLTVICLSAFLRAHSINNHMFT